VPLERMDWLVLMERLVLKDPLVCIASLRRENCMKIGHEANTFKDLLALLDPLALPALPDQSDPLALLVRFFQVLFKFANMLKAHLDHLDVTVS
jgi:hypothetical protein